MNTDILFSMPRQCDVRELKKAARAHLSRAGRLSHTNKEIEG